MLLNAGLSIDLGLGQINSKNLTALGLTLESVFEPCTNLRAMQVILTSGYAKAMKRHGNTQQALVEALSEYNTGHPVNGVRNGYVAAVVRTPLNVLDVANRQGQSRLISSQ